MAQKPAANALTLELEPTVAENYDRHLDTDVIWYAHDYVPFSQGENFAKLGGRDWDPSQSSLPKTIIDACEILLITKDGVAGYHRELVEHFILENNWAHWIGRWTAEEQLHAIALREYLVVTREFDPTANEQTRVRHMMKGYRADRLSQIETLVFMVFFERSHAVFCTNLQSQIEEPVLNGMIGRIVNDENRHEEFFANVITACLKTHRDETIAAIAARAEAMPVLGADIDGYEDKVAEMDKAGIFGPSQLREVISDRIKAWDLADEPSLAKFVL